MRCISKLPWRQRQERAAAPRVWAACGSLWAQQRSQVPCPWLYQGTACQLAPCWRGRGKQQPWGQHLATALTIEDAEAPHFLAIAGRLVEGAVDHVLLVRPLPSKRRPPRLYPAIRTAGASDPGPVTSPELRVWSCRGVMQVPYFVLLPLTSPYFFSNFSCFLSTPRFELKSDLNMSIKSPGGWCGTPDPPCSPRQ